MNDTSKNNNTIEVNALLTRNILYVVSPLTRCEFTLMLDN